MTDSVAKRGRPKLPKVPKLSCLRKTWDSNSGPVYDNTIWQKNADSYRGLKNVDKKEKRDTNILFGKDHTLYKRWKTISDIVLLEVDKNMIIKNECISDSVINASQALLQRQYPHIRGLQNVLLCEIDSNRKTNWNQVFEYQTQLQKLIDMKRAALRKIEVFERKRNTSQTEEDMKKAEKELKVNEDINRECDQSLAKLKKVEIKLEGLKPLEKNSKFVQILLDRTVNRNHWICVSNMRTKDFKTIRIYDNDLRRINYTIANYSNYLMTNLKRLFNDCEDICIELPLVSQSRDNSSGGVFAIAFAQALCAGFDPSDILFCHSSKRMRTHLFTCLERASFDQFPTGKDHSIRTEEIMRSNK